MATEVGWKKREWEKKRATRAGDGGIRGKKQKGQWWNMRRPPDRLQRAPGLQTGLQQRASDGAAPEKVGLDSGQRERRVGDHLVALRITANHCANGCCEWHRPASASARCVVPTTCKGGSLDAGRGGSSGMASRVAVGPYHPMGGRRAWLT